MNLAISSPSPRIYSETFIHQQFEHLPCKLRIHGWPFPDESHPGGPINPLSSIRGLLETAYDVGIRKKRWEGPRGRELERRLKKANIGVLLSNFGPHSVSLQPHCVNLGIKQIVHFHGYDAHRADEVKCYREGYLELSRTASAVIAVSRKMVDTLIEYGMDPKKINLIRLGVDPAMFTGKRTIPHHPTFIAVGRFVEKKAPYLTLLAFSKVYREQPNARLIIIGDGPLLETTRNICHSLELNKAVEFAGALSHTEVAEYMMKSTAFVQHSITPVYGDYAGDSEGTPVAVLEAMMSGLPVVGTRHAGIGEVVKDEYSGLLVEERDVEGMAIAMLRLCTNESLVRELGENGRAEALNNYSSSRYFNDLKALLDSAG